MLLINIHINNHRCIVIKGESVYEGDTSTHFSISSMTIDCDIFIGSRPKGASDVGISSVKPLWEQNSMRLCSDERSTCTLENSAFKLAATIYLYFYQLRVEKKNK